MLPVMFIAISADLKQIIEGAAGEILLIDPYLGWENIQCLFLNLFTGTFYQDFNRTLR